MTKQVFEQGDSALEITSEMIEAGLAAYAESAWRDSASPGSPREIVEAILQRGFSVHTLVEPTRPN